jgi:hypothetical protein
VVIRDADVFIHHGNAPAGEGGARAMHGVQLHR